MLLTENFKNGLCKFYRQIISNDCTTNFYGFKGGDQTDDMADKIQLVCDTAYVFDI